MQERLPRRLAAILYADVAGYSRLTGEDEDATHRTLTDFLDLFSKTVESHHGRIMHYAGDAVLAMFDAVVDALTCAAAIQHDLKDRNKDVPNERKVQFRIGVNMGDVIEDRADIYGDGVNIAARLESLAEPGGICVSDSVYTAVGNKLPLNFEDLGEQQVKNIHKPVRAYRAQLQDGAALPKPGGVPKKKLRTRSAVATASIVVIIGVGLLAWLQPRAPEFEPASVQRMSYPLPDKPSVAVLPFDNYSDDPKLDFFASGLTEDLTSALSKVPGLFVISRNSAATYKGKPVNVKQVAEDLSIQYVLEGSVQKAEDKLRISAQLIDALSGRHLWAGRFDRTTSDIFAVQDEITKSVLTELQVELTMGDNARVRARGTRNLEAWLLLLEGYGELQKWTRESMIRSRELFEAAYEADPAWARPLAASTLTHWFEAKQGWSPSRSESIRLGIDLANRAIELDSNDSLGPHVLGNMYFLIDQPQRGIELQRRAIELTPNDFGVVAGMAMRIKDFGQEREAIELFEHAMRLSPKHPWWVPFGYGLALHLAGNKEEAVQAYLKTIDLGANNARTYARLAAVYADLNRMDEAKAAIQEGLRLEPNYTTRKYEKAYPLHDPKRNAWYRSLLLRAGLPA